MYTKRTAFLLGIALFCVTVVYLRSTPSPNSPSWRSVPQVVGLGDMVSDGDYSDKQLDSSRNSETNRLLLSTLPPLSNDYDGNGINIANPYTSPFIAGTAKPPGSNYTRNLIVAKTKKEKIDWIHEEDLGEINRMVYVVDDYRAPLHPPKNKGHEAMVYLTYIIDYYDMLPDVSIFMHAHRYTWHNNDLLNNDAAQMVKRLSNERVLREGYMNLRCQWMPGCPSWLRPGKVIEDPEKKEETAIAHAWAELFPDRPVPEILAQPCCSQFALSCARIRAVPRERYSFYRDWLMRTRLDDRISGRVWEYLWQVVFTGETTFCPDQWSCYCDGYGVCFEDQKNFDYWFELRYNMRKARYELSEWRKKVAVVEEYKSRGKLKVLEEGKIEIPEMGMDVKLQNEIDRLNQIMEDGRRKAIQRGTDPRFRAMSAGRRWSPGDGY